MANIHDMRFLYMICGVRVVCKINGKYHCNSATVLYLDFVVVRRSLKHSTITPMKKILVLVTLSPCSTLHNVI